jgi:dipeptidyl aminopeptidase/acylaminoacyl peptidase
MRVRTTLAAAAAAALVVGVLTSCAPLPPVCPEQPVNPSLSPSVATDAGPSRWLFTRGGALVRYESDDPFGNFANRLWRVDPSTMDPTTLVAGPDQTVEVADGLSADGRWAAVRTTRSLDGSPDPYPQFSDAWLVDTSTGASTRITAGNGSVQDVRISADGEVVVFASWAADLTPEVDLNFANISGGEASWQDIFVWTRSTGTLRRLTNHVDAASFWPRLSDDGRRLAYTGVGGRWIVDLTTGTELPVPPVTGVAEFKYSVDIDAAVDPGLPVTVTTDKSLVADDLDGATDLYLFHPWDASWHLVTAGGDRISTYSIDNPKRFPFFIVGPVAAASANGSVTVALEGPPDYARLVRRSPSGVVDLTYASSYHHLTRAVVSPDGRTVVATISRYQDDRYCAVHPWRTLVWRFDP